jgi:NADH dehydrogenase
MNLAIRTTPRVLIVGGGFGGLSAAKALARAPVEVVVVDRRNHHVFQPLLYQVATASLSPADISAPIRAALRHVPNARVVLAQVTGVDVAGRRVLVEGGHIGYDHLILAAGATHDYFGHDEWGRVAPGIKTVEDATEMRRRILLAFESAEYEAGESAGRADMTFAIVGGGPTGVELAGAIKEIAAETLHRDYRTIDTRRTRVILFLGAERLLPAFPADLGARAQRYLEGMGVEVRLDTMVTEVTDQGLVADDEFVPVRNVFWAAGVRASRLGASLGVPLDRSGRVVVGPDLSIPGHPEVFVIGDMASARSHGTGEPVPGVAQGAIQMGDHAGRILARESRTRDETPARTPFVYRDKGTLAVIGKHRAVGVVGALHLHGFVAWLVWGGVHIAFLIGFRNRLQVLASWFWNWLLNARDARLITGDARLRIETPPGGDLIPEEPAGLRSK